MSYNNNGHTISWKDQTPEFETKGFVTKNVSKASNDILISTRKPDEATFS